MNLAGNRALAAMLWTVVLTLPVTLGGCSQSGNTPAQAQAGKADHAHAGETGHAHESNGGHEAEAGHDQHGHEGHADEQVVDLTPAEIDEFQLKLRTAGPGTFALTREVPGEITLNRTRVAHVTPRVPGVVSKVHVRVGDHVEEGEVMAVLVSRELAQAKSAYLAALSQLQLAKANYQRAKHLWELEITAKAEYLAAKQALEEARVDIRLARRELYALGLTEAEVESLAEQPHKNLARYELTAPISGEVIQRRVTEGEVVSGTPAKPPFVVADLSKVWVELTIYPKNFGAIEPDQKVVITAQEGRLQTTGTITYVSPTLDEDTRTATARVVLDNSKGRWKPGLFVTARVRTDKVSADVFVPESALYKLKGDTVVFVRTNEGFKAQPVEVGRSNGEFAAIVSGLQPGQTFVAANGFIIKAELLKGTFSGHSH